MLQGLSLLLPELSKFPLDNGAPLDAGNHDLEAVKVIQPSSPGAHSKLAAPSAVLPLVVNITVLHGLLELLLLGHPGDLDGDVGEGETLEVDLSPHHVGGVYQRPVLVHHVHDDHQLPVLRAIVDQGNAPDLNKASEHHGCCWKSKQTDKALWLWRSCGGSSLRKSLPYALPLSLGPLLQTLIPDPAYPGPQIPQNRMYVYIPEYILYVYNTVQQEPRRKGLHLIRLMG